MNIKQSGARVYQPLPANTKGGRCYGVSGIDNIAFRGVTKNTAKEAVNVCNENPEFARNFLIGLARKIKAECYCLNYHEDLTKE